MQIVLSRAARRPPGRAELAQARLCAFSRTFSLRGSASLEVAEQARIHAVGAWFKR
jgi:hypothetical protein